MQPLSTFDPHELYGRQAEEVSSTLAQATTLEEAHRAYRDLEARYAAPRDNQHDALVRLADSRAAQRHCERPERVAALGWAAMFVLGVEALTAIVLLLLAERLTGLGVFSVVLMQSFLIAGTIAAGLGAAALTFRIDPVPPSERPLGELLTAGHEPEVRSRGAAWAMLGLGVALVLLVAAVRLTGTLKTSDAIVGVLTVVEAALGVLLFLLARHAVWRRRAALSAQESIAAAYARKRHSADIQSRVWTGYVNAGLRAELSERVLGTDGQRSGRPALEGGFHVVN